MDRYDDAFREEHRYGSAAWAEESDLRRAGLFGNLGPQIGYWKRRPIRIDGDAPMITVAGARSGKLRDVLAYVACATPGLSAAFLDPRGEIGAISHHVHAAYGDDAYYVNPMGLCGLPAHGLNPLDAIDPALPSFHADCRFVAESLVALTGGGNDGNYFDLRARDWIEKLLRSLALNNGSVTLADLFHIVSLIESGSSAWADHLEFMLASGNRGLMRCAAEMLTKQQEAPREFGSIMGTVYAAVNWLDDPALLRALGKPDFSLKNLANPGRPCKLFLNIPTRYLAMWAPLIRLIFAVIMLYKGRKPGGPRILLVVDEAGQLGRFDALLQAFTFAAGEGTRTWAFFQDTGQIVRNFGAPALQSFFGSAQTRQFFGVRDYETAKLVSDMLGSETLEYDDVLRQEEARRRKEAAFRSMFTEDADPNEVARDYAHYAQQQAQRASQHRRIMTPEEVMALPEDRQILFVAGKDLSPVLGWKYPYYTRREMAGRYLNNPYHPPADKVPVRGWFGTRWLDIVTGPVPEKYAGFSQHRDGLRRYVKGYEL